MTAHSSVLEAALFSDFDASLPLLPGLSCFLPPTFFFLLWRSVNLKTKICLNWLQRAQGGFVSMVMRVLIGPEAQAANKPLLACRGLCLLVSLMNSFADGGWQGLIYQAGTEGWWGWGWLEEVKKENMYKGTVRVTLLELESCVLTRGGRVHLCFGMIHDQTAS